MKTRIIVLFSISSILFTQCQTGSNQDAISRTSSAIPNEILDGDIIFQTSKSRQSKAIQLATRSRYSHMGIIYTNNGEHYVYEAIQPVKSTPLNQWIKRGEGSSFVIKRLKDRDKILTDKTLKKMKQIGEKYRGKGYDLYFEWSDDKIYCSELVWKIYKEAAETEIGELQTLSEFDLSSKTVQSIMKERYGNKIPLGEKVISPAAMFESHKLLTVAEQ